MRIRSGILLVVAAVFAPVVWGAHITDKMAVGLYDSPNDEEPQRVLISGTPLEIVERSGRLCKVQLGDGDAGWLECRYVTEEKPSRVMLVEAQARIGQLWGEIEALKRQLEAKEQRIQGLQRRIDASERLFSRRGSIDSEDRADPLVGERHDAASSHGRAVVSGGDLGEEHVYSAALLGAGGGALIGALGLLWHYRKRYGGLRI
jgi:hypothetical protein